MSGNLYFKKGKFKREREARKKREFEAKVAALNSKDFKSTSKKWDRDTKSLSKELLIGLYIRQNKSVNEIGKILKCSSHKVAYWMEKYKILRRNQSEATYQKRNPLGDPFNLIEPKSSSETELMGMGLGLYWGEGNKLNKNSIRLGNTDPALIKTFIRFLNKFFNIDQKKIRFGLQIFSDIKPSEALSFWIKELKVDESQFQKVVVTPSRGAGTYKKKLKYGVLTVHFNNKKLRNVIISKLKDYGYNGE
ncbi:MAG: hypothetical protein ABSE68_00210 [Minisyncoccia bacterium]